MDGIRTAPRGEAWNKGTLVGQKAPFKLQKIWRTRTRLPMQSQSRELTLFALGVVSKLRSCDLVKLRVRDVCYGDRVVARAMKRQQKTLRPVQFEITRSTREALKSWIEFTALKPDSKLFSNCIRGSPHFGVWQYA